MSHADINECARSEEMEKGGLCTELFKEECSNTDGGYECICQEGYNRTMDGKCESEVINKVQSEVKLIFA